jgi:hypothetical protein
MRPGRFAFPQPEGHKAVNRVSPAAHLARKRHAAAPASVVKYLVPLRALLATAVEDGALRTNPTTGIRVNGRRDEHEEAIARPVPGNGPSRVPGPAGAMDHLIETTRPRLLRLALGDDQVGL